MTPRWIHEQSPRWDANKAAVIGSLPGGALPLQKYEAGDVLPGEWWRVEADDGEIVGYGWLESTWGDAEVLLAVRRDRQRAGAGSFILQKLGEEAKARGINYIFNEVPPTHPDPSGLRAWLEKRGFHEHGDGGTLRAHVHKAQAAS